jgi:hypothetical protein
VRDIGPQREFFRRVHDDHPTAAFAALGSEVKDPVGFGPQVQIMLNHDHRVAGIDQAVQDRNQPFDIGHVQTRGRLIENVYRGFNQESGYFGCLTGFAFFASLAPVDHDLWHPGFREFSDQFDSLGLSPREGRTGLTKGQVTQADILQNLELILD